jgi:hypothetical protein
MKEVTRVRYAAHLMPYIEELHGLHKFTAQEVQIIQDALFLLIRDAQQAPAPFPVGLLPPSATKTYEFRQGSSAPDRFVVYEDGQPERTLRHVPIFAYGFGLTGLSALDSAVAILADFFGEPLSLRAFATGHYHYCHLYQAFARDVLTRPRFLGHFETKHILTFLRRQQSKKPVPENNGHTGPEMHTEESSHGSSTF